MSKTDVEDVASGRRGGGAWDSVGESRDAVFARRRDALISAAARAFHDRNFYETSMDEIADAVGVTKPTLYTYVKSKHEILYECHKRSMECAQVAADKIKGRGGSGRVRLLAFFNLFIVEMLNRGGGSSMMLYLEALPDEQRADISRQREAWRRYVEGMYREGVEDGSIRNFNPLIATMFVMGAISWLTKWYRSDGPIDAQTVADTFAQLIDQGIGPSATSTKELTGE